MWGYLECISRDALVMPRILAVLVAVFSDLDSPIRLAGCLGVTRLGTACRMERLGA